MSSLSLALTLLAAASIGYSTEIQSLPRGGSPEAQGISSADLLTFVSALEQKVDVVHSFVLVRHGQIVAEGWWDPYAPGERHQLYSLSKSFTSMAVGLAISEGKLSLLDPVLSFFPEQAPKQPSENLRGMRIRDLLTMSTGHHEDVIKDFPFSSRDDLVAKFLALPVAHKPGTCFVYNTPATYVLSAIIQKVTGQSVLEYLRPRLFQPLGIEDPTWEASAQGVSFGGFGLNLRTEEIARFGQLLLQRGRWGDRQLVPADWIEAATARQMSNGSSPDSDWDQGYGFQFWRSRHGCYRGDGAYGQFCIVMPQYDAVLAITSGTRDMAMVMNVVWDRILPAFHDTPLAENEAAQRALAEKLSHLQLPTPAGAATPSPSISGRHYTFPANLAHLESLALQPMAAGATTVAVRLRGKDLTFTAGQGHWVRGELPDGAGPEPIAAAGAWTSGDTFALAIYEYHRPTRLTYQLRFNGEQLVVEGRMNLSAEPFTFAGEAVK